MLFKSRSSYSPNYTIPRLEFDALSELVDDDPFRNLAFEWFSFWTNCDCFDLSKWYYSNSFILFVNIFNFWDNGSSIELRLWKLDLECWRDLFILRSLEVIFILLSRLDILYSLNFLPLLCFIFMSECWILRWLNTSFSFISQELISNIKFLRKTMLAFLLFLELKLEPRDLLKPSRSGVTKYILTHSNLTTKKTTPRHFILFESKLLIWSIVW